MTVLDLMLKDYKKYRQTVYGLTPYWEYYAKSFINHIKKHGLDTKHYHRVYDSMSIHLNSKQKERYRRMISYVGEYVDYENLSLIVELGAGSGHQMTMLKEIYPHLTVWLFDIPPFLYVTEHNLSKHEDYVGYENTRSLRPDELKLDEKTYVFPNWKFPLILYHDVDLFWNSGSFQEMEKNVVSNYLAYVNHSSEYAFLYECMDNSREWGVKYLSDSDNGVIDRVWLEDYKRGLKDFKLFDFRVDEFPYCMSMWINKVK